MSKIENYPARLTSGYYRVRETWEEPASQLGAYRLLSNAMAKADENPGYFVFSNDGEIIYPEPESGVEEDSNMEETIAEDAGVENAEDSVVNGEEAPGDTVEGTAEEKTEDTVAEDIPADTAEFPTATECETDDNEETIAYARLKTLMNIRVGNSLDADILTTAKKGTILEILQFCSNGWLRVRSAVSDSGFSYVSNEDGQYADIGYGLYTVKRGDNLWMIAQEQLGNGARYTEIRELNGMTSNSINVGMQLVLPEK